MTKKIGITGVHASGKTALAQKLIERSEQSGKTVYFVTEVARSCPYPLGTVSCQEYIFRNQLEHEKYAMSQDFDTIICDRILLDNLIYFYVVIEDEVGVNNHTGLWEKWDLLYEQAKSWMYTYDIIIRLPINLEYLKSDDPIRPKSESYAKRIDALFDKYVSPYVTNNGWV